MVLNKYKFNELIELSFERNIEGKYNADCAIGVNIEKIIKPMKGDTENKDIKKFYLVKPNEFVYNPRGSRKLGLGFNSTSNTYITTFNNMIFKIKEKARNIVLPEYLFIYLSRKEWDRKAEYMSWGSSTEVFSWDALCDMQIELPDIEIQKKYVAIYKAMLENQKCYEKGLEDLKLTCDAYLDRLKKINKMVDIGEFIEKTDIRNKENINFKFKGLSMENCYIDSIADEVGINFSKYKIVKPNEFACVLMKVGRDCRLTVAQNTSNENYIISPAYYTFKLNNINATYFMSYISRTEFERRAWFSCDTSLRGSLPWEEFCNLEIPNISESEQMVISNLFNIYINRNEINEKLKEQIKNICPILIKGSIEEARK